MAVRYWSRGKDSYGRSAHYAHDENLRVVGAVVALPKAAVRYFANGDTHISNDWTKVGPEIETAAEFHKSLRDAKRRIEAANR